MKIFDKLAKAFGAVSFTVSSIVAVYWMSDKARRRMYYLLSLFIVCVVFMSIVPLLLVLGRSSSSDIFCLNNAVARRQEDGPSLCVANGAALMVALLAVNYCWLLQSRSLYNRFFTTKKKGHRKHDPPYVFVMEILFIFGLPMVSFTIAWRGKYFGYSGNQSWCIFHSGVSSFTNTMLIQIPLIVCFVFGGYFTLMVMGKVIYLVYFGPASGRRNHHRRVGILNPAISPSGQGQGQGQVTPSGRINPLIRSARNLLGLLRGNNVGYENTADRGDRVVPMQMNSRDVNAGSANVHTADRNIARIHPGTSSAFPLAPEGGPQIDRQRNPNLAMASAVTGDSFLRRKNALRSAVSNTVEYNDRTPVAVAAQGSQSNAGSLAGNDQSRLERSSGSTGTDNGGLLPMVLPTNDNTRLQAAATASTNAAPFPPSATNANPPPPRRRVRCLPLLSSLRRRAVPCSGARARRRDAPG